MTASKSLFRKRARQVGMLTIDLIVEFWIIGVGVYWCSPPYAHILTIAAGVLAIVFGIACIYDSVKMFIAARSPAKAAALRAKRGLFFNQPDRYGY